METMLHPCEWLDVGQQLFHRIVRQDFLSTTQPEWLTIRFDDARTSIAHLGMSRENLSRR